MTKKQGESIFVVYDDYGNYENCSRPIAAFTVEADAWEWIKINEGSEIIEVPLNPKRKNNAKTRKK